MEHLAVLIGYTHRQGVDAKRFFRAGVESSKVYRLYELIRDNPKMDNRSQELAIYGEAGHRGALYKLQQRLERKLICSIYLIDQDQPQYSELQNGLYESHIYLGAIQILFQNFYDQVALKLADKLYQRSTKLRLTEVSLIVARKLAMYYSGSRYHPQKGKLYRARRDRHFKEFQAEEAAADIANELYVRFVRTTNRSYPEEDYERRIQELGLLFVDTLTFRRLYNLARCYHYHFAKRYDRVIDIAQEALDYFTRQRYFSNSIITSFHNRIVFAKILNGDYEGALQTINEVRSLPNLVTQTKQVMLILLALNQMYLGSYRAAYESYEEGQHGIKYLPGAMREIWKLIYAHLVFLREREKMEGFEGNFRINKFLNEVPEFSQDKQGFNVSVLIVHILFCLHLGRENEIIDRVDALRQYTYRYLKKDDTYRSHCFIRMLTQLPRGEFSRRRVDRYAAPLLSKLSEMPLDMSNQKTIEVIPYEQLWEMVREMLQD